MRHAQEPHDERTHRGTFARDREVKFAAIFDLVLLELSLQEFEGERRAVDGDVADLAQEVGQRADVVLVPMGQDDGLDAIGVVADVVEVRKHEVDTGHVATGEAETDIDDEDPVGQL